jgi:hypothetical protein
VHCLVGHRRNRSEKRRSSSAINPSTAANASECDRPHGSGSVAEKRATATRAYRNPIPATTKRVQRTSLQVISGGILTRQRSQPAAVLPQVVRSTLPFPGRPPTVRHVRIAVLLAVFTVIASGCDTAGPDSLTSENANTSSDPDIETPAARLDMAPRGPSNGHVHCGPGVDVHALVIERVDLHGLVISLRPPLLRSFRLRYCPIVKDLAGILVFVMPASWLAWASVRVLRSPEESWAQGRSRWMAVLPLWQGERPPSARELRTWAAVWLAIAAGILAFGLAFGLMQ